MVMEPLSSRMPPHLRGHLIRENCALEDSTAEHPSKGDGCHQVALQAESQMLGQRLQCALVRVVNWKLQRSRMAFLKFAGFVYAPRGPAVVTLGTPLLRFCVADRAEILPCLSVRSAHPLHREPSVAVLSVLLQLNYDSIYE